MSLKDRIEPVQGKKLTRKEAIKLAGLDLVKKLERKTPKIWTPSDNLDYYFDSNNVGDKVDVVFWSYISSVDSKIKKDCKFAFAGFYSEKAIIEIDRKARNLFFDEKDLVFYDKNGNFISYMHDPKKLANRFPSSRKPNYYKIQLLKEEDYRYDSDAELYMR